MLRLACGLAIGLAITSPAIAETLNEFSRGWYDDRGGNTLPPNPNIVVGTVIGPPNLDHRNFLVFDLSPLSGAPITSASITFLGGNGAYSSADPTETFSLFDFTGSINALVGGTGGTAAYNDLGSGVSYGQAVVGPGPGSLMPEVTINLSAAAIAALNAVLNSADKRFAVGGAITSGAPGETQTLFSGSGSFVPVARLDVSEVPLPAALPLFASGLLAMGLVHWRRRRKLGPAH